jgi:hypothetical protein
LALQKRVLLVLNEARYRFCYLYLLAATFC